MTITMTAVVFVNTIFTVIISLRKSEIERELQREITELYIEWLR